MRQPIQHKLGPTWARHFEETLAQIREADREVFELEGRAAAKRNLIDTMTRHLGTIITQIALAEKLPQSLTPYRLSPDGKSLVGEVEITDTPPHLEHSEPQQPQERVNGLAHEA